MSTPKHIQELMREILDEISDETGETNLGEGYILKYEGWSPMCFPKRPSTRYAEQQALKIHKEWREFMHKRNYMVVDEGHDSHQGLYGVTYALYKKVRR